MNASDWSKIEALFFELVDLSPEEQEEKLLPLAQTDPDLYEELKALLAEEKSLHPLLTSSSGTHWLGWEDGSLIGKSVGIYHLVSLIGSGGMGSVFEAERADGSFDQKVALKLVKEGLYNEQNIENFLKERQILAKLHHPNIAQLLDGGVYQGDRPFYTLEFIDGLPLDQYCVQQHLGITERLNLFCQVCEAVQYAHSQLILHLDIKPSNILVNKEGRTKLLDFGIAQLLSQSRTTLTHEPILNKSYTLAFASPEQLRGEHLSTSSDVYSLGVLLFQLLSGTHPFQAAMTDREALHSHILEHPPSSLRAHKGEKLPYAVSSLPLDLDMISAKALQKDPTARYPSALALKEDVHQFLEDKPISLRKNDWTYAMGKYLKRNKSLASLASIGLFILIGLSSYYTWELKQERDLATYEASKARRISELLGSMFSQANPNISLGQEPSASEMLNQGIARVEEKLKDDPEMLAEMSQVIAQVYMDRGEFDRADSLLSRAIHLWDSLSAQPRLGRIKSYYQYGALKFRKSEYDAAREALQTALDIGRDRKAFQGLLKAHILLEWAELESEVGNYALSDSLINRIFTNKGAHTHLGDSLMADIQLTLGINARKLQDFVQAEAYYQNALGLMEKIYPPVHPEIAYVLNHLASLNVDQRKFADALPYAEQSYEIRDSIFGTKHPETLASLSNLSRIHKNLGNFQLARTHYETIYGLIEEIYGTSHHYLGAVKGNLANTYLEEGETEKAVELYKEALTIAQQTLPAGHIRLGLLHYNYGVGLLKFQSYKEGEVAFRESLQIREKGLPEDHQELGLTYKGLGLCLLYQGKNEEGRHRLLQAREILSKEPIIFEKELMEIAEGLGVREEKAPS